MIMSLHDPILRKRILQTTNHNESPINKKLRTNDITMKDTTNTTNTNNNNTKGDDVFSEKMFTAYVKSAWISLEKVCCFFIEYTVIFNQSHHQY